MGWGARAAWAIESDLPAAQRPLKALNEIDLVAPRRPLMLLERVSRGPT